MLDFSPEAGALEELQRQICPQSRDSPARDASQAVPRILRSIAPFNPALRGGPRSVGEMVESTSLGQPNVSNHLSCLLDCGLVVREQRGRFGIYSLADLRGGTGDNDLLMAGIARSW